MDETSADLIVEVDEGRTLGDALGGGR